MATILQTETSLNVIGEDFVLLTEYSGITTGTLQIGGLNDVLVGFSDVITGGQDDNLQNYNMVDDGGRDRV